jgi:hypothetical protein
LFFSYDKAEYTPPFPKQPQVSKKQPIVASKQLIVAAFLPLLPNAPNTFAAFKIKTKTAE